MFAAAMLDEDNHAAEADQYRGVMEILQLIDLPDRKPGHLSV